MKGLIVACGGTGDGAAPGPAGLDSGRGQGKQVHEHVLPCARATGGIIQHNQQAQHARHQNRSLGLYSSRLIHAHVCAFTRAHACTRSTLLRGVVRRLDDLERCGSPVGRASTFRTSNPQQCEAIDPTAVSTAAGDGVNNTTGGGGLVVGRTGSNVSASDNEGLVFAPPAGGGGGGGAGSDGEDHAESQRMKRRLLKQARPRHTRTRAPHQG